MIRGKAGGGSVAETDDIGSDLEEAFAEHEESEEVEEGSEEGSEEIEEGGEAEGEEEAEGEGEEGDRERDPATGKFVKGAAAKEGQEKPPVAAAPEGRAPQSWKPAAREAWAKVPAEVRSEITRRERETAVALQESSNARQWSDRFSRVVAPYEMMFRSDGVNDPLQAVQGLLNTSALLRGSDFNQKAGFLAGLIMRFMPATGEDGLDGVRMVDQALDQLRKGGQGGGRQFQGQPYRDPRMDDLLARINQQQQERSAQIDRRNAEDLAKFAETHEFFPDVREVMAKLLESGLANNYDEAYKQACQRDPELRAILAQRAAAARAKKAGASTERARKAATSVRSTPTGKVIKPKRKGEPEEDDIGADIEAAIAELT